MINQIKRLIVRMQRLKNRLLEIPVVQLTYRTAEGLLNHDATQRAAAVAYYGMLSIFPLLLVLITLFNYFLPSINLQDELLKFIGKNLPGSTGILQQNIVSIIKIRGTTSVLNLIILFWSASAMFGAMSVSINRAWNITGNRRSYFIRKASEMSMVLGTGILFLLSLVASTIISILRGTVGSPANESIIATVGGRIVAFLLILAVFLLLYKFIPQTKTYWRCVCPGALLAAILFEIARTLFLFYLENFANYQLIYGSIASIIILLVWIYISAFILILGAEFTFQYDRIRCSATTESGTEK